MKYLRLFLFVLLLLSTMLYPQTLTGKSTPNRIVTGPHSAVLNINRMTAWYSSNTVMEHHPVTDERGLFYPKGTDGAVYISGLMMGAYCNDGVMPTNQPRVNGTNYRSGFVSGAIVGLRTGVTEDSAAADNRIWRIRKGYAAADLQQDASDVFSVPFNSVTPQQIVAVRTQYETDWKEWPWQKGAPFYDDGYLNASSVKTGANNKTLDWGEDVNRNGALDSGEDVNGNSVLDAERPGIANADQVIWFVSNDIRGGDSPWQTKPMGLEQQTTIWGYDTTSAFRDVIFKKFKFIYKGTAATPANGVLSDFYLCHFSDLDLGDYSDDFAGCDTLLDLGFVFNSSSLDAEYKKYDLAPPAIGFDLFQGPVVPSPLDTAIFDMQKRPGYKNLPMTAFFAHVTGDNYSDPPYTLNGSWQWYSFFLGLPPTPQPPPFPAPIKDPITGKATSYWFSGNPVAGTGWLDGVLDPPSDRRILQMSGPFNMAVGDTQEVVIGVVGGLGSDRLASVTAMKFNAKTAQTSFDHLFQKMQPVPPPVVKTYGLDKGVIIEWESDPNAVAATEHYRSQGHRFEGYVVYQLPNANSTIAQSKRIATFDLPTDPATILEERFDPESGQVLVTPVQYGKNSGVKRYLYITKDELGNGPLVNGTPYHFAVTAYTYNTDLQSVNRTEESAPVIVSIAPDSLSGGTPYAVNDTVRDLQFSNVVGGNDGAVVMTVFNPLLQSGATFDVWYGGKDLQRTAAIVRNLPGTEYAAVTASLRGSNLVPPVLTNPAGTGGGTFTLNDGMTEVKYSIASSTQTGAITGITIHRGAPGVNGETVFSVPLNGNPAQGTWSIPSNLVTEFTAGNLYVVVSTAAFPSGELRGQIADGVTPREILPAPVVPVPPLTAFREHRIPSEGISFFLQPAPIGVRSVIDVQSGTGVLNVPSSDGIYSISGNDQNFLGTKQLEQTIEIRFEAGTHYAAVWNATASQVKFIRVPFAVYKDTVRVWPVILNSAADTIWNADPSNPLVRGKLAFDAIHRIVDDKNNVDQNIGYYSSFFTAMPPTSTGQKSALIGTANHIASSIVVVSEKNDGTVPANGTIVRFTMNKSIKIGDIKSMTIKKATSVTTSTAGFPAEFSLSQNFPNPFNPNTRIEYSLPVRSLVMLTIYDVIGREVMTMVNEQKEAGRYALDWNGRNQFGQPLASGVYFYRLTAGSYVQSRKMVLLK
jgi:hypothetical protein